MGAVLILSGVAAFPVVSTMHGSGRKAWWLGVDRHSSILLSINNYAFDSVDADA